MAMNFIQNLGRTYDLGRNNQAAYNAKDLANQQAGLQVQSGQNGLDAQSLAGLLLLPALMQGQAQSGAPIMPATSQMPAPQTSVPAAQGVPSSQADNVLGLFGGGASPNAPTDFRTALSNPQPPTGQTPMPSPAPQGAAAMGPMPSMGGGTPDPLSMPGMQRMQLIAQALQKQGGNFSPAAQFGAFQNVNNAMLPQDKLYNQQMMQEMRGDLLNQRLQNALDIAQMRDKTTRELSGDRIDATERGQDKRSDAQPTSAERDYERASKNFTAMAQAASYMAMGNQDTFNKLVAPYQAEMQRAQSAWQAERAAKPQTGAPAASAPAAAAPSAPAAADTRVQVVDSKGNPFTVPQSQLADAIKQGYKQVQ